VTMGLVKETSKPCLNRSSKIRLTAGRWWSTDRETTEARAKRAPNVVRVFMSGLRALSSFGIVSAVLVVPAREI
jgi:hypothetical protein